MAAETLDVAALDSAATAVETATPALDTSEAEVPVVESPEQSTDKPAVTVEDGKSADKTAATDTATAPITPKVINSQLQELAKTNKPLAAAIHSHVKQGLESQRFLKEVGAKDFAEARNLLSKPDETTENFRQSVEDTDSMLYAGGTQHAELVDNILADLTSELGEKEGPARLSELSENIIEKLKTADPDGHTRITRNAFLAASETSGLIKSLESMHSLLSEGKTTEAHNLLKSIGKFFSEELKANGEITKTRTEAKAAAEKESTVTATKLRSECVASVDSSMNKTLGAHLSPFLKNQLKGVTRPDLENLASAIKQEAKAALGRDSAYVKEVEKLYSEMRTPAQKERLMARFEQALKKDDFGKKLVERVCREKFPERFVVKPAAPKAPVSTKVTIGGASQTVFQLEKKPTNLVRSDTQMGSRMFTSKELELLMAAKGIGLVKNKSGNGHSFVQWKR